MLEVNETNFVEETKEGIVIVDFFTTWCGPCRTLVPVLEELQNAKVVKVDLDNNENLGSEYGVNAIPCLIFFKDGVEVDRTVGLQSKQSLQEKIDKLNV